MDTSVHSLDFKFVVIKFETNPMFSILQNFLNSGSIITMDSKCLRSID
jgi:hypothetical protein